MAEIIIGKEQNNLEVFFTQKELAELWRVTEATIKNIRDSGGISHFFPPNSSRVLYPKEEILMIERERLISNNKESKRRIKSDEKMVKKPVSPTDSNMEWRI